VKFTGFYESRTPHAEDDEVLTTLSYVELDDLLERLRARLEDVPPGSHVVVDLIAWDSE
jgi:hypothetical protein